MRQLEKKKILVLDSFNLADKLAARVVRAIQSALTEPFIYFSDFYYYPISFLYSTYKKLKEFHHVMKLADSLPFQ